MLAYVLLRRTLGALVGCALACLGWLLLAPAAPVAAAGSTYYVGATGDATTTTNCTSATNTTCTLRGAISVATSGSDTIMFNSSGSGSTIYLSSATTLTLAHNVTIDGTGHSVIVDGFCTVNGSGVCTSGGVGVFVVNSGVTVGISNLTIQHGSSGGNNGGGIYNSGGTVTLTNSTLSLNSAFFGGGIFNFGGTMTLTNSTLSLNSATHVGGGIDNNNGGMVTVTNSTLTGNSAGNGGGIYNTGGTVTVTNSTLSGNTESGGGGGGIFINNGATVNVTNSTLTGNNAPNGGGGMFNHGGTVTLTNTIVAGNSGSGGPDLYGNLITSGGHNLIGDITGSTGITNNVNGDIVNNTPLLGTLGNNGGPTQTIPLLAGSPAIGNGNAMVCAATGAGNVNGLDQRGVPRPTATCAIGAFEPQHTAYTVGSTNDSGNAGTLAACQSATNTTCRLRDALALAPSMYDTETITFNGTVQVPITLMSGTLTVAGNVTITGPASGTPVIVDGGCIFSGGQCQSGGVTVFVVNSGVTVGISNLTIQHGSSGGSGGGIFIFNGGTLTLTNSTLTGNFAFEGGGIDNSGTVTVTNSTLSGNSATSGDGGGIFNQAKLTLTNSTLTGNAAASLGGGIFNFGSTVTLTNTIVAGSTHGDLVGTISGNNNLIDDTSPITGSNNITNTPAHLGTLGNYGGPTQTIPLLTGSPAIAYGDRTVCNQVGTGKVNRVDQRGMTRPTSLCAIGAYEPLLSAISPVFGTPAGGTTVTLTGVGYVAGATVSIGGVACGNVQVPNSTTLTCVTGAHAAGVVDVVVTVNSQTGTLTGAYTYGVLNPLPAPQSPGPPGVPPNPLPVPQSPGAPNGTTPNPLPVPRP